MTDTLDKEIVAILGQDGRTDAVSIAEDLDVVPTTVQKHLRALEDDGVIEGYTVRLNYESLGYQTVVLRIKTSYDNADAVTTRLRETTKITAVYETSDRFNVFAIGKFESNQDLGRFLEELHSDSNIQNIQIQKVQNIHSEGRPVGRR